MDTRDIQIQIWSDFDIMYPPEQYYFFIFYQMPINIQQAPGSNTYFHCYMNLQYKLVIFTSREKNGSSDKINWGKKWIYIRLLLHLTYQS